MVKTVNKSLENTLNDSNKLHTDIWAMGRSCLNTLSEVTTATTNVLT